jgi:hypothetical protein
MVNEDFKTMAYGLMTRSQEVQDFTGWKGYLSDVMPKETAPTGDLSGSKMAKDLGEGDITSGRAEALGLMRPGAEASAGGKPQFFMGAGIEKGAGPKGQFSQQDKIDRNVDPNVFGPGGRGYNQLDTRGPRATDDEPEISPGQLPAYSGKPVTQVGYKPGSSDAVWRSIYQQESSSGKDTRTSSTGAIGPGQIMPGTFREWAKPGENIRNPDDNVRVSKRMVEAYHQRYGGDPARVAVAYFSGPGNVAPAGSLTPWKRNSSDGAVSVSQYVQQVVGRMGGNVDVTGVPKAASREGLDKRTTTSFGGGGEEPPRFKPDTSWLDAIVNQRRRRRTA